MGKRIKSVLGETPESLINLVKKRGGDTLVLNSFILGSDGLTKLLPKIATELPNLKVLEINGNDLDSLPDSIGLLRNLEHLDVSNNKIKRLPDSFKQLTNLKGLRLINNKFKDNPGSGLILDKLKISLEGNPLTLENFLEIAKDTTRLNKFYDLDQYLFLKHNQLKNIPDVKFIAYKVAELHPDVTAKEFYKFLDNFSEKQIKQINPFKLSYKSNSKGKFVLSLQPPRNKKISLSKKLQSILLSFKQMNMQRPRPRPSEITLLEPNFSLDITKKQQREKRRTIFPEIKYYQQNTFQPEFFEKEVEVKFSKSKEDKLKLLTLQPNRNLEGVQNLNKKEPKLGLKKSSFSDTDISTKENRAESPVSVRLKNPRLI